MSRFILRAATALCVLWTGVALNSGDALAQVAPSGASIAIPTNATTFPSPPGTDTGTPFSPPSSQVTVELSTALGDDAAKVRQKLAGYPFVRLAQHADYTLTTKPEFTQTLMLVDGSQGESRLNSGDSAGDTSIDPQPLITLGNLALEDYDGKLTEALVRTARAKALLAAETPPSTAKTLMCAQVPGAISPSTCLIPGERATDQKTALDIGFGARMLLAVRNTSNRPMYLYLLGIDPQFRVRRFALPNDGLTQAGAWAESTPDGWPMYLGPYHFRFVTIASATPIPSAAFDPWIASAGSTVAPLNGAAYNWSISTFDFAFAGPNIGGVANGFKVPPFSAPWAVQLYATVPYTEAQLKADEALPPGTRKYLRERSEVERQHACGGTLIAGNLVLTAAHCVASGIFAGDGKTLIFKRRRIRAGTHELGAWGTTYAIDGVAVHAGYQANHPGSPDDIALLLLKPDRGTRTVGTLFAAPIAVASHGRAAAERVAVYGWGVTAFVDDAANWVGTDKDHVNHNPDTLQFGTMQTLAWKACQARLKTLLGNRMLCAVPAPDPTTGRLDRPVFSCVGDSGGPLIGHEPDGDVLVGIVSWSKGCGVKNAPDVYTDVARYADWVNVARATLKSGDYISVPALQAPVER